MTQDIEAASLVIELVDLLKENYMPGQITVGPGTKLTLVDGDQTFEVTVERVG